MVNPAENSQQGGGEGSSFVQNQVRSSHISSSLPQIDLLVGRENWPTWKFAVQTFLELEDLWEAVVPTPNADGTLPPVDALKNRSARSKIILLIHPENYIHVMTAKTARDVWAKLEETFEDSGLTRKVGLLRKLITSSLATSGSMEEFVNGVIATAHQLRGIGFQITDEWVGTLMLAGLPEEYRPMIMALENSGAAITADVIKTKLLQEVRVPSSGAAFASNKHGRKPAKQNDVPNPTSSKGPKCRRCHKFGHIARECSTREPKKGNGNAWCTVMSAMEDDDDDWYFDSGASNHFAKSDQHLESTRKCGGTVVAANRGAMKIVAKGSMKLSPKCCPDEPPIAVGEVQVIPELSTNLLSVNQIVQRGHTVTFTKEGVQVVNPKGDLIATGSRKRDLFKLDLLESSKALACASNDSADLWHRRLGHINYDSLQRMKRGLVSGIEYVEPPKSNDKCRICAIGKQTRLPFSKSGSRASDLLEVVHSDICGPMEEESLGGSRYYLSFTDDKSRRIFVYFLKEKSGECVFNAFEEFRCMAERQTGKKLKTIRTDNGKEFTNRKLEDHLKRLGIRHQTTADYTPEQNGLAERVNRTIVERARCMLYEAGLPKSFWAEATATAVYLVNRSPTKGHSTTPEEMWSGWKPNLAHVRVFGSKVMAHVPKPKRKKWDAKAFDCILTGFDEETKAYRLWDPKSRKIVKSRDVTFISEAGEKSSSSQSKQFAAPERKFVRLDLSDSLPAQGPMPVVPEPVPVVPEANDASDVEEDDPVAVEDSSFEDDLIDPPICDVTSSALPPRSTSNPPESQALRRSGRERYLPGKLRDFFFPNSGLSSDRFSDNQPNSDVNMDAGTNRDRPGPGPGASGQQQGLAARRQPPARGDPRTSSEALNGPKAKLWKQAMDEEYLSQMEHDTWELVELPPDRKAIGCKWLYKTKEDEKGNIVRHKARLVAQGFNQKPGVDFDEVFAPVAKQVTLRTLLTVASQRQMVVKHMDVKTAYLHGKLDETIYMRQPEGYAMGGPNTVCLLKRSIYGLKQSARVWNRHVDAVFRKLGFKPSSADPCLYVRKRGNTYTYVLIYVDDMLVVCKTEEEFNGIHQALRQHFDVTSLGDVRHFLGIEIERDGNGFVLNQGRYILKLAERFGLENAKPTKVPLDPGYLQQKEEEKEHRLPNNAQYLSLIGGLLYVAVQTRPDIAVSVSILAQKSSCPTQLDWHEAKRILRYLKTTFDHKLYLGSTEAGLEMFADADWAGNHRDRKSNSGYLIRLGGGVISWASRKQTCVALSSTEAELVALTEACQELSWLKKLMVDLGEDVTSPIPTYEDNQSCIRLVENGKIEKRSKHIATKYFYVRDLQEQQQIILKYCPTEFMLADILTKPLQHLRLKTLREKIGLHKAIVEEECRSDTTI